MSSTIGIVAILKNINSSVNDVTQLVTAGTYLMGFIFFCIGLYKLKQFTENRNSGQQSTIFAPIFYLITGIAFTYWPSIRDSSLQTVFGSANLLSYTESGTSGDLDTAVTVVINIVRLLGFISFMKGWYLLTKIGQQQQGGGSNAIKSIMHIGVGVLAMNIVQTWDIIENTLLGSS